MSNVERMDILRTVRTVLKKNPGIKAKDLTAILREKTGLSRSTIYEHLSTFYNRDDIYRNEGKYWLKKPENLRRKGGLGFFDWLDRRAERKERRRKELMAKIDARMETISSGEPTHQNYAEKLHKHRKKYGLE